MSSLVEPRFAAALSALNSTGPLLANVLAVATLVGLYFAAPTPAAGLTRVTTIIAALLALATACATRAALTRDARGRKRAPVTSGLGGGRGPG